MKILELFPGNKGFWLGLLLFFVVIFIPLSNDLTPAAHKMAAIAVLMAVWWMSEALPLGITALLPLVLYPLTGIMKTSEISGNYMDHLVFLFMGGFMIAIALQEWNLHRRFALFTISLLGSNPRRIFLAFMLVSALLSMWISNTATAIMMLPIAVAVIGQMQEEQGPDKKKYETFAAVLLLGIAYGSSMGGIATLIGTPPNIIFMGIYKKFFPDQSGFTFFGWMLHMLPLSFLLLMTIWLYLGYGKLRKKDLPPPKASSYFKQKYKELGPLTVPQIWVLGIFILTALLWIFRSNIDLGIFTIPGWPGLLGLGNRIQDSTIAMSMAILLFVIHTRDEKGTRALLKLSNIFKIPWDILLLFGGGFALAEGIQKTGLAEFIGNQLGFFGLLPFWVMLFLISISVAFLTEFTSNTAVATTLLPILAALSFNLNLNPFMLMLPATIASSCAYMLPVATPPNAIVFGSRFISIQLMVRIGIWLNFMAALIISSYFYFIPIGS
jgi:sodium-dependent dicarboxylate transporter 2/3/5